MSDSDAVYLYPGFELGVAVSLERGKMVRGREATPARIKADRYVKLVNYLFIYPIYLISNSTFYPPGTGCRQWRWSTSRTRGCWSLRTRALTSQPRTVPSGACTLWIISTIAGNEHSPVPCDLGVLIVPEIFVPALISTVGSYGCRDVWDMVHVYVGPSQVEFAGEGLYAR